MLVDPLRLGKMHLESGKYLSRPVAKASVVAMVTIIFKQRDGVLMAVHLATHIVGIKVLSLLPTELVQRVGGGVPAGFCRCGIFVSHLVLDEGFATLFNNYPFRVGVCGLSDMASDLFDLKARDRARRCLQLAADAEALAKGFIDPQVSASYRRIAGRWVQLAAEAEAEARAHEEEQPVAAAPHVLEAHREN